MGQFSKVLLPLVFQNHFRINPDVHQHNNTRNSNKLFIEYKRTEQGKF